MLRGESDRTDLPRIDFAQAGSGVVPRGEPPALHIRVARQLATVVEVLNAFNDEKPERKIVIEGLPEYRDLVERGLGAFLRAPPERAATAP
jgi:hypothetical protein